MSQSQTSGRTMVLVLLVWAAAIVVAVALWLNSAGQGGNSTTYNGVCSRSAPQDC